MEGNAGGEGGGKDKILIGDPAPPQSNTPPDPPTE